MFDEDLGRDRQENESAGDLGPPAGPPAEELRMALDTLLLFPEEQRCALVWRGHCRVASLEVPEIETVTVRLAG